MDPVRYFKSEIPVQVGDHVEFKVGLFFWRGWQKGRVYYVPGISPRNDDLERDGLSWVSIHGAMGSVTGFLVDPMTRRLSRAVRFLARSDDGLKETPVNYQFPEE
jgi:hypothetical protein